MSAPLNTPRGACPGCGAPLEFKVGSAAVIVCEHCRSAVARSDRGWSKLGKVADLVPTGARLGLGHDGVLDGKAFTLVGRVQLRWREGVWDEWYAAFADGRGAWIAEAQGRYYVTFEKPQQTVPPFDKLRPGQALAFLALGRFVVSDLKEAVYVSAIGELPEVIPLDNSPVRSADLSGPSDAFVTIDYADEAGGGASPQRLWHRLPTRLREALERQLRPIGGLKVREVHGMLLVVHRDATGNQMPDIVVGPEVHAAIGRTFGVVNYAPARVMDREITGLESWTERFADEFVATSTGAIPTSVKAVARCAT